MRQDFHAQFPAGRFEGLFPGDLLGQIDAAGRHSLGQRDFAVGAPDEVDLGAAQATDQVADAGGVLPITPRPK